MSPAQRSIARQQKLRALTAHPHYGKLFMKLQAVEHEHLVAFLESFGDLEDEAFERKALRFGLDFDRKPKNVNLMAELLLACRRSNA